MENRKHPEWGDGAVLSAATHNTAPVEYVDWAALAYVLGSSNPPASIKPKDASRFGEMC